MSQVDTRLKALGIELPEPSTPGANYVPFVRTGDLVFLSGQLSQWNGERRFVGKLGREFGLAEGQAAARLCALNLLAHLRQALAGDLDRVVQTVRLAGYVNSMPDFVGQSQVMNGASDAIIQALGSVRGSTRGWLSASAHFRTTSPLRSRVFSR
jgi:enamine deaminase RidA (YjgF/YER057c/UK114 family)